MDLDIITGYIVNKDEILHSCLTQAKKSREQNLKYNHGAIGIYKGKIVSRGHNSRRTSWLQRLYANKVGARSKTCEHAEVAAIRKAKEIDTLFVVRINSNNSYVDSTPCCICRELIQDSGVKHLYYSDQMGNIKYERI